MSNTSQVLNVFQVAEMLSRLNEQQRKAAMTIDGRYLVLAGAGAGKTSTLTARIANLLVNGVNPSSIFVATFTNKASREMKERLAKVAGESIMNKVWMGTFHSLCVRILRKHGHLLGYGRKDGRCNFVIYDSYDCLQLVERIYKSMNLGDRFKPGLALHYIDSAKNKLFTPEYCLYNLAETPTEQVLAQVYERYQFLLKEANAMDFGDLIMNVIRLLDEYDDVREYWQNKFQYILCDEYQDTNPAQFQLLVKLAEPQMNIFVVGDVDQSIYGFRGSDVGIIMNFEKHFSPCEIIKLEHNYRSTNNVVQASNYLISHNDNPYGKTLYTDNEDGDLIEVVELTDEYNEAAYVGAKIKQLVMSGDYQWKDFAILYRNGFQSAAFEQVFVHNFIPYKVIGGHGFFDREEVKDLISYLRVIYNRKDDTALMRIINKPTRGIGQTTQDLVENYANQHKVSIYKSLKMLDSYSDVNKRTLSKVNEFLSLLDHFEEKLDIGISLTTFVRYVLEHSGLHQLYQKRADKDKNDLERLDNLDEFLNLVQHYETENPDKTLDEFLQELSLLTDYHAGDEPNAVQLMTVHASKGLEFPVVFVVGLNENIFPGWRAQSDLEVQEERRLMYVAITRAEKKLILTYVQQRQRSDGRGIQTYQPSRFLSELPEEKLEKQKIG